MHDECRTVPKRLFHGLIRMSFMNMYPLTFRVELWIRYWLFTIRNQNDADFLSNLTKWNITLSHWPLSPDEADAVRRFMEVVFA